MVTDTKYSPEQLANIIMTGNAEVAEAVSVPGRKSKEIQYWRMCPSSKYPRCERHRNSQDFIIIGPAMSPLTAIEYTEFQMVKHAEPLANHYGRQEMGVRGSDMHKGPTRFNSIILNGGINEFCVQQMVDYGWHKLPAVVMARPELVTAVTIKCPHGCQRREFYGVTEADARFLMEKHVRAMHKDTAAPMAIGREITKAVEAVGQSKQFDPEMLAQLIAGVMAAMDERKFDTRKAIDEVGTAMLTPDDSVPEDKVEPTKKVGFK